MFQFCGKHLKLMLLKCFTFQSFHSKLHEQKLKIPKKSQ